jgi:hypothetical protein
MGDVWLEVSKSLLRPARPDLARCMRERERHLSQRAAAAEERVRAIAACERRIESARAAVFAASDGVVGASMTELEREWRRLSRPDPDAGMMDLWAHIAPPAWIDRKRWRESVPCERVDVAVALAADVSGVEAAEAAALSLRSALGEAGTAIGAGVRWRFFDHDRSLVSGFAGSWREKLREDVREAVLARLPDRPLLARDVALVASAPPFARPIANALRALWRTGYVLSSLDATGVTLEIAPIDA